MSRPNRRRSSDRPGERVEFRFSGLRTVQVSRRPLFVSPINYALGILGCQEWLLKIGRSEFRVSKTLSLSLMMGYCHAMRRFVLA